MKFENNGLTHPSTQTYLSNTYLNNDAKPLAPEAGLSLLKTAFKTADKNHDGKLTSAEVATVIRGEDSAKFDKNHDGKLSFNEFKAFFNASLKQHD